MTDDQIDALVAERDQARKAHDWRRADAIRAQLAAVRAGTVIPYRLELTDTPAGTRWHWTARPA